MISKLIKEVSEGRNKKGLTKKGFLHHTAVENFDHRSHPVFAKKDFGRFLA